MLHLPKRIILLSSFLAGISIGWIGASVTPSSVRAQTPTTQPPVSFGVDPATGDVVIKKGDTVSMRIDSTGSLIAPLKSASQGENLILNGGFESDVDDEGGPDNWTTNFQTSCSTCMYSLNTTNTIVYGGAKALSIAITSAGNIGTVASDGFEVIPGKTYTASVDVRGNYGAGFSLRILYYRSDGNTTYGDTDTNDATIIKNNIATTGSWTSYSGDFTVPSTCGGSNNLSCTRARMVLTHTGTASSTRYFDNAKIITAGTGGTNSAANVSSAQFGSNTGGGDFSFPSDVGIGTTAPAQALDLAAAGANLTFASGTGPHQIFTGGTTHLSLMPGGNVGIGTTAPTTLLDIAGQFGSTIVSLGDKTGAVTVDWNDGNTQHMRMTGNVTLTFSNGVSGRKYTLILKQDGDGTAETVTWPASVRWSAATAPTLTAGANKTDYIGFIYNSVDSKYDGVSQRLNF